MTYTDGTILFNGNTESNVDFYNVVLSFANSHGFLGEDWLGWYVPEWFTPDFDDQDTIDLYWQYDNAMRWIEEEYLQEPFFLEIDAEQNYLVRKEK